MLRVAEANAKMHLRDFVTEDDVNMAIRWDIVPEISFVNLDPNGTLERQIDLDPNGTLERQIDLDPNGTLERQIDQDPNGT